MYHFFEKLKEYGLMLGDSDLFEDLNFNQKEASTPRQYAQKAFEIMDKECSSIKMVDCERFCEKMNLKGEKQFLFRYFNYFFDFYINANEQTVEIELLLNRETMIEDIREHLNEHAGLYPQTCKEFRIKNLFVKALPTDEEVEYFFDLVTDCFQTIILQTSYKKMCQDLFRSIQSDYVSTQPVITNSAF